MTKVQEIFKDLEIKHDIKILYAVEAGSRAWGLESEDSDYDMRFIYQHNDLKKYVSLRQVKETIDGFSEDRLYDWQGWDITKSLKHLKQMNPGITEWLYSPIVYLQAENSHKIIENFKELLVGQNRIYPLLYHYRSMAKSNFKTHIQNNQKVKIKKYLYVIRPAGMFLWLMKCRDNQNKDKLIDIDFNKVLIDLKPHLTDECYENIVNIIERKKKIKELDEEPRIECIDKWLDHIINGTNDEMKKLENEQHFEETPTDADKYDALLHSVLNLKL